MLDKDILILSPCLPDERRAVVDEGFIPVVSSTAEAKAYAQLAESTSVRIHLSIDTGMGRIGVWQKLFVPGVSGTVSCLH